MEEYTNEQEIQNQHHDSKNTVTLDSEPGAQKRHLPVWAWIIGGAGITIVSAVAVALTLMRGVEVSISPTPLPPTEFIVEVLATPEGRELVPMDSPQTEAAAALPPTPTPPPPTAIILPTPTPTEVPPQDSQADVVALVGGQAIDAPPQGADIASCNIAQDTQVVRDLTAPVSITQAGDKLVVWLTLNSPPPAERDLNYHWLVALDVDDNAETGRPKGAGYINPELGTEIGAGVFLYTDDEIEPYLYIWDSEQGDWAADSQVPEIVEATFNEARDAVAISFPLVELNAAVEDISGVSITPNAIKGRTAIIASSNTAAAIVDYCPDLP